MPGWLRLAQHSFVLWVLLGALWGYAFPDTAAEGKAWIPEMLALVMLGMGLTLTSRDIRTLHSAGRPLLVGVCLQFLVMPLCAWLLARVFALPDALAIGLILVGAAPGGTASNVVTYLARGDVALSIAMTTASTLLAPVMTPLWAWLLASAWLPVNPLALLWSVVRIVLLPVVLGIGIRTLWHPGKFFLDGVLPLGSMLVIAWIVGVVTALNHTYLGSLAMPVIAVVLLLNAAGLLLGYLGARQAGQSHIRCRTVSIEVGMQNSGLAVALAVAHFSPLAALPGALFSLWHNVTGPVLASIWRGR